MNDFFKKKGVEITFQRYGIDVLGSMAYGLFASLLVGSILNTLGKQTGFAFLSEYISPICSKATGPAIGMAIAYSLKAPSLVLFSSAVVGLAGYELGGPVGTLISVLISTEIGKLISKETPVDIVVTPAVTILTGGVISFYLGEPLNLMMTSIGSVIITATDMQPFIMGIIVSVIVGIILTLPISSAALCIMLSLSGIAAGAAAAGCSAQMIGFAAMSYHDNKMGGVVACGLGTSMLQIPNIMKNPLIWIPPTIAAAITGPISSVIFKMTNTKLGAGMGTCGLVGQIEGFTAMSESSIGSSNIIFQLILVHILLPAIISLIITAFMRKKGLIKDGDLKLNY